MAGESPEVPLYAGSDVERSMCDQEGARVILKTILNNEKYSTIYSGGDGSRIRLM